MEAFLLFCVLLAQGLTILAIIGLRKDLDFSKEDALLKDATQKAQDELDKIPPQKN